jgi:hypothetical protein
MAHQNTKIQIIQKMAIVKNVTDIEVKRKMDEEIRKDIMDALNKAVTAFENHIFNECNYDIILPIRFETREVRMGDFTLGESLVIDQLLEYEEEKFAKFQK